jgi:hypothetical protein
VIWVFDTAIVLALSSQFCFTCTEILNLDM